MKAWHVLLIAGAVGGCGEKNDKFGPQGPFDPGTFPAEVIIVEAAAGSTAGSVTVHLMNAGDSGAYKLEFYGLPRSPNGPETFFGSTEPVEVGADYEESPTYTVNDQPGDPPIQYILALTRDQDSATYRQTDRFDLP